MSSISNIQLVAPTVLTVSDAAYYTVPVNVSTRIGQCVFSNPTAGAVKITLNIVAVGGASTAANQIINARTLAAGETFPAYSVVGAVLPAGSMIRCLCDTAAAAVLTMSGAALVT